MRSTYLALFVSFHRHSKNEKIRNESIDSIYAHNRVMNAFFSFDCDNERDL